MKRSLQQSGFTLIELLIYIAVVSVLLSGITAFIVVAQSSRVKNQNVSEVNDQGLYVMDYVSRQYRNSSSAALPNSGTSSATLSLVVGGLVSVSIGTSSGSLQSTEVTGSQTDVVALTNSRVTVTNFSVTNVSRANTKGAVRISLTLADNSPSTLGEYTYSKTFVTTAALR